ncbi:MAG: Glycosyltransferase [Candidatus Gottesmanbacteria bacterium GW2011_GWC2_42_8]|nr:MAG: Glycosyltransferase [Candidatus Gottesmanbacteria bacterium GW2011_GWC2_42_8]
MYMGTIDERFNLEIALEAIPSLIKRIPDLRLIIIPKIENEGSYYRHLLNRINKLKIYKYIIIKKPLSLEAISKEIHKADIGLTLVKKNLFTERILPLKLTEFLACGIPVVATKTKLLEKTFSDKMICFLEKNTSDEFYRKVLKLYRDKNLRNSLKRHTSLFFKKYNWPAEEKKYYGIINLLMSQQK